MTVSYKRASYLIKKYNAGFKLKNEEFEQLMEWINDFKEQLVIEEKAIPRKK